MTQLSSTVDHTRLQLATSQSSIFSASIKLLRSEHGRYLGLLHLLVGQFDRLDNTFTNLLASVRGSCATLRRGIGPLFDAFRAFLNNDDVAE